MLSRVAETVYWMIRYIERAENTARLISSTNNLLLDLPRDVTIGWQTLVDILGANQAYSQLYQQYDERNVMRFLITAQDNPNSIISCLNRAKENARGCRNILPKQASDKIRQLHQYVSEFGASAIYRKPRHQVLSQIISLCQQLAGIHMGSLSRDARYQFVRLGVNLERADMTTRIVDTRSASLLNGEDSQWQDYASIAWRNVLKSLSAELMYHQHKHPRIRGVHVVEFLLSDRGFPRSVHHCLAEIETAVRALPHPTPVLNQVRKVLKQISHADLHQVYQTRFHQAVDELQLGLIQVHEALADNYFQLDDDRWNTALEKVS